MISALAVLSRAADDPALGADLRAAGIAVLGEVAIGALVQEAVRHAPDVVICYEKHPGDAFFTSIAALSETAPRPVVLFTPDPDAEKIERAMRAGVHAYVVNGYGRHRLRAVIHAAQARFRQERLLREELVALRARFDERKLVDRAKGILMRARQVSEDEAFKTLRTTAMQTKQRLGQVALEVIEAARYGDAVNRAGQLRMISQRLVTLYAAEAAGLDLADLALARGASIAQVEETITLLRKNLSQATFGDLIEAVAEACGRLKAAMVPPVLLANVAGIDKSAEDLLQGAERLTATLEAAGLASTLRVINVSGRQRMLSQKMAKLALIGSPPGAGGAQRESTLTAFAQGLAYLKAVPLSTPAVRADLDVAERLWEAFQAALAQATTRLGQAEVVRLSEDLVALFDRLTDRYERSLEVLLA